MNKIWKKKRNKGRKKKIYLPCFLVPI